MGCFFPIAIALSYCATFTAWWVNLIVLAVVCAAGILGAASSETKPGASNGCALYLLLTAGFLGYETWTSGLANVSVVVDCVVLGLLSVGMGALGRLRE
jgi:hypothetical protein